MKLAPLVSHFTDMKTEAFFVFSFRSFLSPSVIHHVLIWFLVSYLAPMLYHKLCEGRVFPF